MPEVSGRVFVQAAAHAEVGQRPRIPGPSGPHRLGVAQGTVDATAMCDFMGGLSGIFLKILDENPHNSGVIG